MRQGPALRLLSILLYYNSGVCFHHVIFNFFSVAWSGEKIRTVLKLSKSQLKKFDLCVNCLEDDFQFGLSRSQNNNKSKSSNVQRQWDRRPRALPSSRGRLRSSLTSPESPGRPPSSSIFFDTIFATKLRHA